MSKAFTTTKHFLLIGLTAAVLAIALGVGLDAVAGGAEQAHAGIVINE